MLTEVPWSFETFQHRSPNVSAIRTINLYPEQALDKLCLIGCPGTSSFVPIPVGSACRGIYTTSTGRLFVAYGGVVYEIGDGNPTGSILRQWNISGLNTLVSMADNGTQLVIVDGTSLYCISLITNNILPVDITIELTNPEMVVWWGGYFYVSNGSNRLFFSDIDQGGTLWTALNSFEARSSADNVVGIALNQGALWILGERSYEVWTESGNPDLPLRRVNGTATDIGCASRYSIAVLGGSLFWLGSAGSGTGQVFKSNGYQAEPIANQAIAYILNQNNLSLSDAYACVYQQENHTFYCLSLVTADRTIVYDDSIGLWHERASRNPLTNVLQRWDVAFASFAFGKVICGNLRADNPAVLLLSLDKYDEYDGRPIVRIHQGPTMSDKYNTLFHVAFEVEMETGVGLQNGQGSSPVAMLDFSDDWGHTWSGEYRAGIGKIGQYQTMVRWTRLGKSRGRVYRVTISDPVKVVMLMGRLKAEVGGDY